MTPENLVLYHASCNDGFCAAWLFWRYIDKEAEFIPVQYGEPFPRTTVHDRNVFILDFSYPRDDLLNLRAEGPKKLLVLDHHKTAEEELKGLDFCVFDKDLSGATLTWRYFFNHGGDVPAQPPWLLRFIGDRDLWRFKLDDTRAIHAGLQLYPYEFKVWEKIHKRGKTLLVVEGMTILKYTKQLIESACSFACEIELDGHKVLAVNATNKAITSDLGHKLSHGYAFGVVWFATEDKIVFSLRSTEEGIDVAELAKKFGGGGHQHAAGFSMPFDIASVLIKGTVLQTT